MQSDSWGPEGTHRVNPLTGGRSSEKQGTGTEVGGVQVAHTSCPRAQVLVGHNLPQGWPCFWALGLLWQLSQHQV